MLRLSKHSKNNFQNGLLRFSLLFKNNFQNRPAEALEALLKINTFKS